MTEQMLLRVPRAFKEEVTKVADRHQISVSAAARLVMYRGLEVENVLADEVARATNYREHPELWRALPEVERAKLRAEWDTYVRIIMLAENALGREGKDLNE